MTGAEDLTRAWLDEELEREPTVASALGVEGHDEALGDFSVQRWRAQPERDRHWAGRLDQLGFANLDLDDQVDVTLVLTELARRSIMGEWESWRRDPSLYLNPCLNGLFEPWLQHLRPEEDLVSASIARLEAMPAVLEACAANLDPDLTPPLFATRGAATARAGVHYLLEALPGEAADPRAGDRLAAAATSPASALEQLAERLESLAERASGHWAIGETRYSALLGEAELLGIDAPALAERGQVVLAELDAEMTDLALRLDPDASGWVEVLAEADRDHPATPEAMRVAYESACEAARAFLVEHSLVTLPPGERCVVVPSPLFQRPVLAVASYQSPPPFSSSRLGHFFVPFPPEGETPDGVTERLMSNSYPSIPTTAVHEAYPGHHWHLTHSASNRRPVRKVLTTSYFVEGWALYAETLMHEQGFFTDPRVVLSHLAARLFRAARVVIDVGLHCGSMTPEEASSYLQTKVGMTATVARAEVERYCSWPTQAASYLTGSLQIKGLRDRWLGEGRGDLCGFHDAVAANPGLPVNLVERLLFA